MGDVVQECFDCKSVVTVADGTPFFYGYAKDRRMEIDENVWDELGNIAGPGH